MTTKKQASDRRIIALDEIRRVHLGGVSRATVYNLIKAGQLRRVHVNRRAFITADSLEAYLDRIGAR